MHTHAAQLVFHFQSSDPDDGRLDALIEAVRSLVESEGAKFAFQSMRLRDADYRVGPCATCGELTVDRADIEVNGENMLPDFWFNVRRGAVVGNRLLCDFCRVRADAV